MPALTKIAVIAAVVAAAGCVGARAEKSTVCTITVNSADERDAFRRYLPGDRFQFVELVERGRSDWLASACRQQIRCDLLIVSGHFAGTEFYTSRFDVNESLPVDEMERVQCSDSCPQLFSHLKEVYLFGCDSLKSEPVKSAMPEVVRGFVRSGHSRAQAERMARALSERHAESSRDRMRRVFPGVPVIYGFSALAPYGRTAGPLLHRYFESGSADEIGSGRPSARLLGLFGPSSMVVASGLTDSGPQADHRREACRYFDDRVTTAQKVGLFHRTLGGEAADVRMAFDRTEKFFSSLGETERQEPTVSMALAELAGDRTTRERYLAITHETQDPALRVRMIALARNVGWLTPADQRAELEHLIGDVIAGGSIGFGEVDLICTLNRDHQLDPALQLVKVPSSSAAAAAHAAALACLGSPEGRSQVLKALASPHEHDVQVAQAFLRHRPITDAGELRAVASGIARMKGSGAQVRALDTLARHHISDRAVLDELAALFTRATSLGVQRAIAEIFLRADFRPAASPELASLLREHRLRSPDGEDLIDVLIRRLQPV